MKAGLTTLVAAALLSPVAVGGQEHPPETPSLHMAALQGNLAAVRRSIDAGADLNARDAYGSTPLVIAATFDHADVARALIAAGADVNRTTGDGATALHTAAFLCRTEIVEALLRAGANKHVRDGYGNTAFESVAAPFDAVRDVYDQLAGALAPLGLTLDYDRIRDTRPRIADLLRTREDELESVNYAPVAGGDWVVSTPAAEGLDPRLVAELYLDATGVPTLYGLLVVRHGRLVAEGYFHEGGVAQLSGRQSMTKSVTSAMVGLALDQGYLSGVDQKMVEFFPEVADQIDDPRKEEITIRHLLQMRAGFPWEERARVYFDTLFMQDDWRWVRHIAGYPLVADPGTQFNYSNLTSHLLAVIVARAVNRDLASFSQEYLFGPIGATLGRWTADPDGYNFGWGEIYLTARDMARFGRLYLDGGVFERCRVLPAEWVTASLRRYSKGIMNPEGTGSTHGRFFRDIGYGYQWWSARVGPHRFDYAAGHGGQLIVLLHDLDMVIVTTADPLYEYPVDEGWIFEGAVIDLVGRFIASLPEK